MIESSIQLEVLSNCKFWKSGARYSQLKSEGLDNDLFNYHLQQLVKKGFLSKQDKLYFLSERGKSIATNIDDESGSVSTNYKVSVYLCPVVNGKVLLYRRLKHPQYGYVGLVSGKMRYGERVLGAANRELLEETGLRGKFRIVGNLRQIRKNESGEVIEDGIFYVCFTDLIEGELCEKGKEGEYFWVALGQVPQIEKIFKPSLEIIMIEVEKRIAGEIPWEAQFIYELEPEPEDY